MRENTGQNNSEHGHFSRNEGDSKMAHYVVLAIPLSYKIDGKKETYQLILAICFMNICQKLVIVREGFSQLPMLSCSGQLQIYQKA